MSWFPCFLLLFTPRPMRFLLVLVLATSCVDTVSEHLAGQLVQMVVFARADTCTPPRISGDGGVQFVGVRPDGTVVLTIAQTIQYGPLRDGGTLDSTRLLRLPAVDDNVVLGAESACALAGSLRPASDGGVTLEQRFPGADECPSGPLWLPATSCTTSRDLALTPLGPCSLECVRLSASSEVSCEC